MRLRLAFLKHFVPSSDASGALANIKDWVNKTFRPAGLKVVEGTAGLFKFRGVRGVIRRMSPELIILDDGFDDLFLLIRDQIKLQADI
jgi:hypothetical protein